MVAARGLVGTATLNYDVAAGGLDAAFSGSIRNIDRGTAHGLETAIFSDLAFGPDGTCSSGQSGARIQGGFYGPGHAEAASIFEQSNIVGAFGATRSSRRVCEPTEENACVTTGVHTRRRRKRTPQMSA